MPRLSRPRRRREESEKIFDDDNDVGSIEFDDASKPFSSSTPPPSPHPLDAALDAIRSLPTFRLVAERDNGRIPANFAALSWPFGGQKRNDDVDVGALLSTSIAPLSSSSPSSSSPPPSTSSSSSPHSPSSTPSRPKLPPVPEDLLSKTTPSSSSTTISSSPSILSPPPPPSSSSPSSFSPPAKDERKRESDEQDSCSSSSFSLWPPRFPSLPSSLPQLPSLPLLVALPTPGGDPEKRKLLSVADFFDEAKKNTARLWRELDADGDGWASEADVARALASRGLPPSYAPRVLAAARSGGNSRWWATRLSRKEFARWMERNEPRALRAFTSMALDRSGRLDARGVKDVLRRSGVAATDEAARGVLRALQSGGEGEGGDEGDGAAASYAQFRSFVALLPPSSSSSSSSSSATKTKAAGAFSSRPFSSSSSAAAATDFDFDDDDDGDGGGGSAPGFDPATAWFDAASIVPLLSSSTAAASLEEESRAATSAAAAAAASATATAATKTTQKATTTTATAAATKRQRQLQRQQKRAALLRAALAGGIASGATTLALFPLDCLKTRLQASGSRKIAAATAAATAAAAGASTTTATATTATTSTSALAAIVREGLADKRALYRGVVPASLGSFFSHGLRTFSYEAALMILTAAAASSAVSASSSSAAAAVASTASQLRLQALASAAGTAIGTCVRIPTEVLKQRLQVGLHANALDAALAARRAGGLPWSLFAGTGATLAREVPFYAAGMAAYEALKNVADGSATSATRTPTRELARWEMVALGGCAGAIASLFTTPADVLKTKVMTAPPSAPVSAAAALRTILREEGVLALWRGAGLRALWVAPLGAMNFAGYELAKRALERGGSGGGSGGRRSGGESRRDGVGGVGVGVVGDGENEDESQQQQQHDVAAAIVEK